MGVEWQWMMPPISISYLQSRSKTKKDNQLAATKLTSIYWISMNKSQSQAKHSKTHFKHKSVILSLPPFCWFLSLEVDFNGHTTISLWTQKSYSTTWPKTSEFSCFTGAFQKKFKSQCMYDTQEHLHPRYRREGEALKYFPSHLQDGDAGWFQQSGSWVWSYVVV